MAAAGHMTSACDTCSCMSAPVLVHLARPPQPRQIAAALLAMARDCRWPDGSLMVDAHPDVLRDQVVPVLQMLLVGADGPGVHAALHAATAVSTYSDGSPVIDVTAECVDRHLTPALLRALSDHGAALTIRPERTTP